MPKASSGTRSRVLRGAAAPALAGRKQGAEVAILGRGWELHVRRVTEQERDEARRTVGTYQVHHDGQPAYDIMIEGEVVPLFGATAESPGPGQNEMPATPDNPTRIREGRYPLRTAGGTMYKTVGYRDDLEKLPAMPGIGLGETGNRFAILIHPGKDVFLSSYGCINLCRVLPDGNEIIAYAGSRRRVIALIEDMRRFLGAFPDDGDREIAGAAVVIEGEPGT
jgi:hypothetical protein